LERRLDDLEKIPCYNDLDNVISQKEITSAISKLKKIFAMRQTGIK
jgi:hypothetical protein